MSSVLYDAPGPVARRREAVGSVVGAVVLALVLGAGGWYGASRGVFAADRWDVLVTPPKNQSAADQAHRLQRRGPAGRVSRRSPRRGAPGRP